MTGYRRFGVSGLECDHGIDGKHGKEADGQIEIVPCSARIEKECSEIVYVAETPFPEGVTSDQFTYTAIDDVGNTSTATITVTLNNPLPANIGCGHSGTGHITEGDGTPTQGGGQRADFYAFQGTAGARTRIALSANNQHAKLLALRDPSGAVVSTVTDTATALELNWNLTVSGRYIIEVIPTDGLADVDYTLQLLCPNLAPLIAVSSGGVAIPHQGTLAFGTTPQGQAAPFTKIIRVENRGSGDLNTANLQVTPSTGFSVTPASMGVIPPSGFVDFAVFYAPSSGNSASATLSFEYNRRAASGDDLETVAYQIQLTANGSVPGVVITAPGDNAIFQIADHITFAATALPVGSAGIQKVEFFAGSHRGGAKLGEDEDTLAPFTFIWPALERRAGIYTITARATDTTGLVGVSEPITVAIVNPPPNRAPVPGEDFVTILKNAPERLIQVLSNDKDPDGDALTITSAAADFPQAQVTVSSDGKEIRYTPAQDMVGQDIIRYTLTDGRGATAIGTVSVRVVNATVAITSPANSAALDPDQNVNLAVLASSAGGAIIRVEYFANNMKVAESFTDPFTAIWRTPSVPHEYRLKAIATDSAGSVAESAEITVRVGSLTGPPKARIENLLADQVLREGLFDLIGTADDPDANDAVSYGVQLFYGADSTTPVGSFKFDRAQSFSAVGPTRFHQRAKRLLYTAIECNRRQPDDPRPDTVHSGSQRARRPPELH